MRTPEKPMPFFRFWLTTTAIPRALTTFWPETGDPVPEGFNRHAAAHTVDRRQFTELYALVGVMLALARAQIAYELKAAGIDDEGHGVLTARAAAPGFAGRSRCGTGSRKYTRPGQ